MVRGRRLRKFTTWHYCLFSAELVLGCVAAIVNGTLQVQCEAEGGDVSSVTCDYDNGTTVEACMVVVLFLSLSLSLSLALSLSLFLSLLLLSLSLCLTLSCSPHPIFFS